MSRAINTITAATAIAGATDLNIDSGTLFVDTTTNNVGIGTASPSSLLHIENATGEVARFVGVSTANTRIAIGNATGYGYIESKQNNNNAVLPLSLNPSGGNVGVGTASPSATLEVVGNQIIKNTSDLDGSTQSALGIGRNTVAGDTFLSLGTNQTNDYSFIQSQNAGNATYYNLLLNPNGGNVGVGTASPNAKLQVSGAVVVGSPSSTYSASFLNVNTGSNNNLFVSDNGAGSGVRLLSGTDALGSYRPMDINGSTLTLNSASGGNVGVGTNTAIGKFTVEAAGGGASTTPITTNSITGAGTRFAAAFYYSGTKVGSIDVTASATLLTTSSDYRLKTNVKPISNGIERVKQLPVYSFNWKIDQDGNKVDGFFAHEAKAIVPECVSGEKDAVDADGKPIHQGIDQSKIVPLLTAALKEAIAKIETLESKVTALEAA